jgi:hypothetical protein
LFYKSTVYGDGNELFFQTNFGADKTDVIVADVHTDVPDEFVGDPGSVLHEAADHGTFMARLLAGRSRHHARCG